MTSIDDVQEKTHPEPSVSHSGANPELKKSTPTLRSALFRNLFSFKAMSIGSSPGKLPAFLMVTTLLCLATIGAASPLINPEEHRPAEVPHIAPEEHRPIEVPHLAPEHPAYHPAIPQPHHESEEEGEHRPEQPAYHTSFPRPRREFKEEEHRQYFETHRPEGQYHPEEQHRPEGENHPEQQPHTEEQYHPAEQRPEAYHPEPEVRIRSPLPQSPAPLPAGAYTPSTACPPSLEGQWNCMLTSWQRCGSGIWSAVMPTAKGTQCAPGGIAAELKTVNAPEYPPSTDSNPNPDQPQLPGPQGNTDGWGQGLPPKYSEGGRVGVSIGLAIAGVVVVVAGLA
ncbi:hypothetical protein QBC41DRAFT_368394 [Cercophora samala]|uniref:Uncharacterized protein n=1 Tax=Cercophora samala TaxID=330535 RepID=A0AA40D695_9PEZI|nr:hypothetical protein QBC41DRAFT_368394 [Cercophora samala]